jgi:cell wall-associated NlpC family hydrolase
MTKAKHRKRSKLTSPRVLGGMLLVYSAAAVTTFNFISPNLLTPPANAVPSPSAVLGDMNLDTVSPRVHTQPDLADLSTPLTSNPPSPIVAPMPAPTQRAVPIPLATPPPAAPRAITPPDSGGVSFRAKFYNAAKQYINAGIPYVYGGKSLTSGSDCSGFIWRVLQQLDSSQPYRTSYALDSWTTNISFSAAQPGDLLFWPDHVAVYAGNNQVITQGGPGPGPKLAAIWPGYTVGRIPL